MESVRIARAFGKGAELVDRFRQCRPFTCIDRVTILIQHLLGLGRIKDHLVPKINQSMGSQVFSRMRQAGLVQLANFITCEAMSWNDLNARFRSAATLLGKHTQNSILVDEERYID